MIFRKNGSIPHILLKHDTCNKLYRRFINNFATVEFHIEIRIVKKIKAIKMVKIFDNDLNLVVNLSLYFSDINIKKTQSRRWILFRNNTDNQYCFRQIDGVI